MFERDLTFIAQFISKKLGVIVKKEGNAWKTNIRKKVIYYPVDTKKITEIDVGLIIHEAAHIKFTKLLDLEKEKEVYKKMSEETGKNCYLFRMLLNAYEDLRVESLIKNEFLGAKTYITYMNESLVNIHLNKLDDIFFGCGWDKESKIYKQKYPSYIQFIFGCTLKYQAKPSQYREYCYYYMSNETREAFDKSLWRTDNLANYLTTNKSSVKEVFDTLIKGINVTDSLAGAFISLLPKYDPEKDEKQFDETNGVLGESGPNDKEIKGPGGVEIKGSSQSIQDKQNAINQAGGRDESGDLKDKTMATGGRKGSSEDKLDNFTSTLTAQEIKDFVLQYISPMRKAIELLKEKCITKWESGYGSGKIDSRRIKKIYTGSVDLFKRKRDIQLDNNDIAIAILVDTSGSMDSRKKNVSAALSTSLLAKAFEEANKACLISTFDSSTKIIKQFNKKMDYKQMTIISNNVSGGTNESHAIRTIGKELSTRPEKKKILMVLTDGGPNDMNDSIRAISEISKFATVYGIGLMEDSVKNYYPMYKIIDDSSKLPDLMKELFKQWSKRKKTLIN